MKAQFNLQSEKINMLTERPDEVGAQQVWHTPVNGEPSNRKGKSQADIENDLFKSIRLIESTIFVVVFLNRND